jgi:homoserine kinase type II
MGIKRDIDINQIKKHINISTITPTTDGVRDSVYILDDKYILKILEDNNPISIANEKILLSAISSLKVPKILDNSIMIDNRHAILYSKIDGSSLKSTKDTHIAQISSFLKAMHSITKGMSSTNERLFDKDILKQLIHSTNNSTLMSIYDSIDLSLSNDGLIHGDLFLDNAKFVEDKLSGVYDFLEACEGDFLFDLAVVAISWCIDDSIVDTDKISTLLAHYDDSIDIKKFVEYMRYALLYYATTRYINNRDYNQLLGRISLLEATYD